MPVRLPSRKSLPLRLLVNVTVLLSLSLGCTELSVRTVEVSFVLDAARETKASEGVLDEDRIDQWYILIYDSSGRLLKDISGIEGTSTSMVVDGTAYSDVTLYAFANYPRSWMSRGWSTEAALLSNRYCLEDVGASGLIPMSLRLNTGFSSSKTVVISLERMLSKIRVHGPSVNLLGEFSSDIFSMEGIYLLGAVGEMSLGDYFGRTPPGLAGLWFYHGNWMYSCFPSAGYQGSYDEMDGSNLLGGGGNVFYSLPNFNVAIPSADPDWADLTTKLVVEASYFMVMLGDWLNLYYPVEMISAASGCLEPNNIYDVDMVVMCPGYLNPWGPRIDTDPQVRISVRTSIWSTEIYTETI